MLFKEYVLTDKGKQLYNDIEVDEATQQNIYDWFQYRELCDDERFYDYFRRDLNNCLYRYNEQVRVDLTKIDPMVSSYRERLAKHAGVTNTTGTSNNTVSHTGTDTHTTTNAGTNTTETVNSGKDSHHSERTPDLTNETANTGTQGQQQMGKQNPQSIAYANGASGMPETLDWQYSTTQGETRRTDDLKQTTTTTGTEETDGYTSYGHTTKVTVTPSTTTTVTDNAGKTDVTKGEDASKQTNENEDREIWTGRDGLTPQEALDKMRQFLRGTNALDWLLNKLEDCFLMVYELEV